MSEKRITRAGELGRQSLGPLPEGWTIKGGFINYDADAYCKYILDKSGRLDRNSIALTLENYGYPDHARRWFLSPAEMVAGELVEALRETVQSCHDLLEYAREALADHLLRYGEITVKNGLAAEAIRADIASAEAFIRKGEAAIAKADGRTP